MICWLACCAQGKKENARQHYFEAIRILKAEGKRGSLDVTVPAREKD